MRQLTIFDFLNVEKKIEKPIRLIELFAGIGSQAKALENLGVDFEHHRVCEFDKYAVKSYNAIHGTNFVPSDITQISAKDLGIVDTDKYEYIMTYSFPCQDLSNAGKMQGMSKGSGTRSGLLWEVERLLNECEELPQILVMENVSGVHSTKNMADWQAWLTTLERMGYTNYWQDLDAQCYGVPQRRNRCFMISLLGNYDYKFPKPMELTRNALDLLDDEVDDKYYLSDNMLKYIGSKDKKYIVSENNLTVNKSIACTITTREGSTRADTSNYICKYLPQDYNIVRSKNKRLLSLIDTMDLEEDGQFMDAYNQKTSKIAGTITTGVDFRNETFVYHNNYIRKMTPKECFRLMGFSDTDYEKAHAVNSNSQLYKQAGNSIVVDVLMAIFKQLL